MWSSRARATVLREYMAFIPTGFSMYSSMTRGQYSSVQFIGRDGGMVGGWGWRRLDRRGIDGIRGNRCGADEDNG